MLRRLPDTKDAAVAAEEAEVVEGVPEEDVVVATTAPLPHLGPQLDLRWALTMFDLRG